MESPREEGSRTIADYTGWIRRRWWVIVAVVLVGLAATALFTARQPRVYTATTSVLVQATGTNTDQTQTGARNISGLNMDTEAQLVTSLLVADRARILLDTDLPAERLASQVTVTVPPNTQVLGIGFSAGEPAAARNGSQAFARAYLAQRAAKAEQDIAAQITALEAEQRTQLRELQELSGAIAGLAPDSVGRRHAEAQLAVVQNSLTPISSRLSTLRASEPNPGAVISAATLPTSPSSPHLLLEVGSGLGAALLLGLLLALLLDRADTRVHGAAAVADRAGVPVLLDVRRGGPPTLATDRSPADRDFGRLRTSLASALDASGVPEHRARIVVTCGASPGPAAGLVTANLALSLDRFGVPVLVVCADPGSWTPTAFDVPAGPGGLGLADVLRGEVDLDAATVEVSSGLRLLGPGAPDESGAPPQEMREDRVRELVARLYACPGYVLFEAPSPEVAVDAEVLAGHADAVLLVVETKRTRIPALQEASRRFAEVRAPLVAAVVVGTLAEPPRRAATRAPAVPAVSTASAAPDVPAVSAASAEVSAGDLLVPDPLREDAGEGAVGTSAVLDATGRPVRPLQDDDTLDLGEPLDASAAPPEVPAGPLDAPAAPLDASAAPLDADRIRSR
jgi:succinoglycan biosynthesis transport protein ExoP